VRKRCLTSGFASSPPRGGFQGTAPEDSVGAGRFGGLPARSHCVRLGLVFGCIFFVFCCIGVRLVLLQTDPDLKFSQEELRHVGEVALRIPRGEIRDCENRLLAKDRQVYSLWADPRAVTDPEMTAMYLGASFGVDPVELQKRLDSRVRGEDGLVRKFAYVKRWLTDGEVETFKNLDPMIKAGLALENETERFYPEGDLAAHVLGFVNRERNGCAGVELSFDKYLRSIPGKHRSRVDGERTILESLTLEYVEPQGGKTVFLTIDKTMQRTLEKRLDQALVDNEAPQGMGIMMDPNTGAILALACRPAFDPNEFWDVPPERYKNRAVVDVFEPGSSFKIVTAAAALEHGLITPSTLIDCENGRFNPYGHRIRDFHKLGVEPFTKCFTESSNIAIIKVAAMLGPERLAHWIDTFGFGKRTCRDFRAESAGIFRPISQWSGLTMGSLPMGQEIAVTMPQLAKAFCIVANGGYEVEPYLVERVLDRAGGVSYQHTSKAVERIISASTARTVKELCHLVVRDGTGEPANIPEYRVGGKTGTAQIARPDGQGFYEDKYTTIFAGFAPVSSPRIVCVIVVSALAVRLHYGGPVCGPVFRDVVRDALIRMNCPEDPVAEVEGEKEGLHPKGTEDTEKRTVEEGDTDTVIAREMNDSSLMEGVDDDDLLDGLELDGLELVRFSTDPDRDEARLPSLIGLTKNQARDRLSALGIQWDPQGAGRVASQDPPAGTPLRSVSLCRLVFSNNGSGALSKNETSRLDYEGGTFVPGDPREGGKEG